MGELIQLGGSGGTPSANNPDYYGGDIPFLSIADINGRDITNTAKTLTDEGLQNSAAWIVPSGAVSLAMYASVGKIGIIRQDTATSQAFYNMVFDNEALRDFVFTRLEKAETDSEWEPYISTGTQRNLNADKVKSFSLDVPSNEEASEISAYFANLDTLITLHQRKCQYRGLYGYLSWEQRKLSEVATFGGGHTPSMADSDNYEDGCVLWVTSQDVKSSYLDRTTTQITEKGAKKLTLYPAGSLVMVTRSGILRHTLPVAELRKPSTVNQDIRVILPQDTCCGGWLLQFFISRNKELLLEFGKTGTTVESVDFGKIKDMLLRMPSSVEQQQIGRYFAQLDSLITLHQ